MRGVAPQLGLDQAAGDQGGVGGGDPDGRQHVGGEGGEPVGPGATGLAGWALG